MNLRLELAEQDAPDDIYVVTIHDIVRVEPVDAPAGRCLTFYDSTGRMRAGPIATNIQNIELLP